MNRFKSWARGIILSLASLHCASAAPPSQHEEGRKVYNFRCYYCHGYSGDARTLAATLLDPRPADFTRAPADRFTVAFILDTLLHGRPGTAMKPFASVIPESEMQAVAHFVRDEFVLRKAPNTRYHTAENGWPTHERYQAAYPFATGEIPLTRPWDELSAEQARGRTLYLETCVSCHDRGAATGDDLAWDARPLSYPRNNFSYSESLAKPPQLDAIASASPYAKHDVVPRIKNLTRAEKRGERLFQANCAFCHGADGSGKNWIGQFLEPHPRNLRDPAFMADASRERLEASIREGLPGTSMPAWKEVLSRNDIRAIIDYISRAFHALPPWQTAGNGKRQNTPKP